MSPRQRVLLGLFLAATIGVSPLAAQSGDTSSWAALRQLSTGQRITIELTQMRRQDGEFMTVIDDAISLRSKGQRFTFQQPDVLRVSTRGPSRRLRNIALGAAIGAAAGALVAGASKGRSERGFVTGVDTLIGLGAGAGVGAALPANRHRTIYRKIIRP